MLTSCCLCRDLRDLVGSDHRKKKRLHGPGCASAKELLQVLAGVALEKFPTLSDQKAVSKPPPSRLQSVVIFLLSHVALRNPERRFFLKFVMYNNVIAAPFLPKIADCAQQDHVLDLTRVDSFLPSRLVKGRARETTQATAMISG